MDNLENQWNAAKQTIPSKAVSTQQIIEIAKQKKKSILYFHYGNILIFTITLVIISLYFRSITLKETISKAGMYLMLSGLSLRLAIEIFSTYRSKQIRLFTTAVATTNNAVSFYRFRKMIHGPASIIIVVAYVLGFYLLTPEFSIYIPFHWMIIMHLSFVIAAIFIFVQAKKGMQNEMKVLKSLIDLKAEMDGD